MTSTNDTRGPSGALGFYLAAVLGLAVSLDTSWRFFGERLDILGAERVVMFTVLEVALLACGYAMRANVQRHGAPGSPRVLAWALLALSGYIAWDLSGPVQGLARVGLGPLLAVVMLHAALGIEIRARRGESGSTWARIGRELRERALSRLGLADDTRDALTRTRERHARRAARLALTERGIRRDARLTRALRLAQVGIDERARSLMLAELAVLKHGRALATLELPAPWADAEQVSGQPSGPSAHASEQPSAASAQVNGPSAHASIPSAQSAERERSPQASGEHSERAERSDEASGPSGASDEQPLSERTYADGVLDAAVLAADTPPPWEGMSKAEAIRRADAVIPGRSARQLRAALAEVGLTVPESSIRRVRAAEQGKGVDQQQPTGNR